MNELIKPTERESWRRKGTDSNLQGEGAGETQRKSHGNPEGEWELLRSVGHQDRGGRVNSTVV